MKRDLIILMFLVVAAQLLSEETTSKISVQRTEVSNGVLIVSAINGSKRFELQCNVNLPSCTTLKPGTYAMVQLPKGHGMYECDNVDVYKSDPLSEERIGTYCLVKPQ